MSLFDQVSCSSVKTKKSVKRRKDMVTKVGHLYPTTEPAEGGLLQPRFIPKELRQFVPTNVLAESGASGQSARLRPSTFESIY